MANRLRETTATEMLAKVEAVEDVAEAGQEGHMHPQTREINQRRNNRFKQKERPSLWYHKERTARMSRPKSASSVPRQSCIRVSLLATIAPATSVR